VPTYEFKCIKCDDIQEVTCSQKELFKIEPKLRCKKCGGNVKRKLAPFVTHFNFTRGK